MVEDRREAEGSASGAGRSYRDRPWLDLYPPGVPEKIDTEGLGTLVDLVPRERARLRRAPRL